MLTTLLEWGDKHAAPAGPPRVQVHTRAATTRTRSCTAATAARSSSAASCGAGRAPARRSEQRAEGVLPKPQRSRYSLNTYITNGSGSDPRVS